MIIIKRFATFLLLMFAGFNANATALMEPTPLPEAEYPNILYGKYDSKITPPDKFLGFEVGEKTATPEQINNLVNLWAEQSNRINIIEYARTYENRPLHYLIISSADNVKNIDKIKSNVEALSTPGDLSTKQVKTLIDNTPATAWMAYSIHGNESSGADSALALIYHLIASEEEQVKSLLSNLVVLVDPMMNPDGRARFTKQLEQNRSTSANFDVQSLLHSGVWPFGRTNHYHFDLNRDFYYAVNPESRGRITAINQWFPLLMIDGHEMGALDTFLFGPPREPINEHIAPSINQWSKVFAKEQAAAFDKKAWPYYTGEWFENLYPGYSNYSEYKGSIHILYEQARTAEDGVRLENGQIRSYKKSVHHQFYSSMTNLETLSNHKEKIFSDFVNNRKAHVAKSGIYANKSFIILPTKNKSRLNKFLDLLDLQGIEYYAIERNTKVHNAKNQLGQKLSLTELPAGSIVIPNRQYDAPLIAAILEFDAKIKDQVLLEERQKTLRDGSSVMYDATAWNLTMLYGLEALEVGHHFDSGLKPYLREDSSVASTDNAIAYLVDGANDGSVGFAARLLEQGVNVRALDREALFNDLSFSRGSIAVTQHDNKHIKNLVDVVTQAAADKKVSVQAINQGLGDEDLPDIGGEHFKLLKRPQIALLTQTGISPYDYGHIWHMLDTELGIRHSHLSQELFNSMDLRSYNVLIIPGRWYGELSKGNIAAIDVWVKAGGTLIVTSNSINQFAKDEKFTSTSLLSDTFDDIEDYNIALYKEWLAEQTSISNENLISSNTVAESIWFPWQNQEELKPMGKEQLSRWDSWTSQFMPSGALVATRTDQKSWLTYGVNEVLPVLTDNSPLLMTKSPTSAVVRYGVLVDNPKAKERLIGWSTIPKGKDLYLRMSGLVWPEASQRISNSAYLTRDKKGNGQVIMFANSPNFRGATKGTARLLLNAIVYGPGLGAYQPINL
ncbi:M14 family zinc carboxypeptidase [Thalassomonas sp. M1454]|uniref:M14 family zinc carboxypeptidase n=1 Tax=Thalassomonas sp. M1454 TaxID=2594477 RepID=UPI00117C128F|nr:M14 family zinc carboxypeptidase [Thalassomonas sp. M1454]TRX53087.1 peptidase [Thalassomonas sp. M1454]